ncbi:MAG: FAD-binding protein [Clostridia bacterium]|nr:FAD-binding protein [Clostridia bacterium]
MLRLSNFPVPLDYTEDSLRKLVIKKLGISEDQLLSLKLYRRSVDARDKGDVHFVLSLDLQVKNEGTLLKRHKQLTQVHHQALPPLPKPRFTHPPLVVGAGPAGLFCALTLARAGANPILIERGKSVEDRTQDVTRMTEKGLLDEESNVQFGEGGAGAFSDGKLTCGVKSPYLREVLETFVTHGAPENILIDPKPHIGTDRLKPVVASIRNEIIQLGGTVLFETRLERLILRAGNVVGVEVSCRGQKREIETEQVLLAIGHSARDTVQRLFEDGVRMEQKPFAMGVRIEHPRKMIDQSQYGAFAGHPRLGAASYKLTCHTQDGRGVYTFCMCPGGHVIAAASQPEGVVVNGMSYHARDAENSNAALLVGVRTEDFGDDHPLAGFILQRKIERAAYRAANLSQDHSFFAPAQRVEDFLQGTETNRWGDVHPSYRPGVTMADLRAVLPEFMIHNLKIALPVLERQLHGFALPDAVLTAPETRSSSPVRLPRDGTGQAEGISGLYPVGEGAGYAGGIVSAALDGISAARKVLESVAD